MFPPFRYILSTSQSMSKAFALTNDSPMLLEFIQLSKHLSPRTKVVHAWSRPQNVAEDPGLFDWLFIAFHLGMSSYLKELHIQSSLQGHFVLSFLPIILVPIGRAQSLDLRNIFIIPISLYYPIIPLSLHQHPNTNKKESIFSFRTLKTCISDECNEFDTIARHPYTGSK